MKSKTPWIEYRNILNNGEDVELQKANADLFMNEQCPKYLYKYFSIPDKKKDKKERFRQLKDELLWLSTTKLLNDPFDLMMAKTNFNDYEKFYKDYLSEVTNESVILCLTTNPTNSLMWSHYSNAYKGFCVKFKVENFTAYPIEYISKPHDYTKIYKDFYDNKDRIIYQNDVCAKKYAYRLQPMYYLKQKCWKYENEFRIIKKKKENDNNGSLFNAKDLGLEIVEIIYGFNCQPEDVELLKTVCDSINKKRIKEKKQLILKSLQNKNILNKIKIENPSLTKEKIVQIAIKNDTFVPTVALSKVEYTSNFKLKIKGHESTEEKK